MILLCMVKIKKKIFPRTFIRKQWLFFIIVTKLHEFVTFDMRSNYYFVTGRSSSKLVIFFSHFPVKIIWNFGFIISQVILDCRFNPEQTLDHSFNIVFIYQHCILKRKCYHHKQILVENFPTITLSKL